MYVENQILIEISVISFVFYILPNKIIFVDQKCF